MERVSHKNTPLQRNSDDIFGEYLASELKALHADVKQKLKYDIQSLLHFAQSASVYPNPLQQHATVGNWDFPTTTHNNVAAGHLLD